MPFTPYHFGPAGFISLLFRRWIDLPVFVLANVIIDVEVLAAGPGYFPHRHWHWHSFLIAALVGAVWGLAAYPLSPVFKRIFSFFKLDYHTTLKKTIFAGALGACFHVLIDGVYHYDVQPFWPYLKNPMYRFMNHPQVMMVCYLGWAAAILLYGFLLLRNHRRAADKAKTSDIPTELSAKK